MFLSIQFPLNEITINIWEYFKFQNILTWIFLSIAKLSPSSSSSWTELASFSFLTPTHPTTQPPGKVVKLEI